MSTVLGKSPELAGYLMMISKLYDAVADIVIGTMSDRTRSRWGRRRPYLLLGAFVSAASFLMIFVPPTLSDTMTIVYMLAALVLYSTGYSLFNVPYMSMPSEMTSSKYERSRLLSFRTVFVSIGQLLAIAVTASLISSNGGGFHGYAVMASVMGLIIVTAMVLSFFGTAKAPTLAPVDHAVFAASSGQLRDVLRNRPFVMLMGAKIFQFLSFASLATTALLFMLNVLRLGYYGQMQLAISQNIAVAASMPLWLWLERRIGKRNAYFIGIGVMSAASLSWLPAGRDVTTWGILIRGLFSGLGSGGMILLSISMLSDTLAYDRELTGRHREGLLSSIAAIVEKAAFAIGVGAVGVILRLAHYIPTRNGALVEQPATVVAALTLCFAVLPVLLFVGNAVCIWFYDLGGVERRTTVAA